MNSIILAVGHEPLRQALVGLLDPFYNVIGTPADGPATLLAVAELAPDLLILDLALPILGGLAVAAQIAAGRLRTPMILLTPYAEVAYVVAGRRYGISGYLYTPHGATNLYPAVIEVLAGRPYLSPPLTEEAVDHYLQQVAATGA